MRVTETSNTLFDEDLTRVLQAARRSMLRWFRWNTEELEAEHRDLETGQQSPFLEDFEMYYRSKIERNTFSLQEVIQKIENAIWVPGEIRRHMGKHIALVPPTAEELKRFEEREIERELDRLHRVAQQQNEAMIEFTRMLDWFERRRNARRSRLSYLEEVKIGRTRYYFDRRRRRKISLKEYRRRVRISKAMLARNRVDL
ncbi:MAG: hypothetical protein OK438_04690 [Thaumarchaeota archaeon]|nr:hypothetical protein [Nitrososphaerota archaeon]